MPYQTLKLGAFIDQIGDLMDDPTHVYWTVDEIQTATYEALRVWGAYTNYWRARGSFHLVPDLIQPFYDMSVQLPDLRPRTTTLDQVTRDIQTMLLEPASGISGAGMTGQVSIQSILNAIQVSRNRFVLDTHLPINVHSIPSPAPTAGMIEFPQNSVFVHRASWQDVYSGAWNNLWRQDAWMADKGTPDWTLNPSSPLEFSEAENAPLKIQVVPPPQNTGNLEILSVDSVQLDLTDPASLLQIPDEWVHAVKYAALSYILYGEGQIQDVLRGEYAEKRYQQAIDMAREARSVIRLQLNGVPVNIDTMFNIDSGFPYWRNQSGPPTVFGTLYDIVAPAPALTDQTYGMTADVVQAAPLPATVNDYMPVGGETLDAITSYVSGILAFKCGGEDLQQGFAAYDSFMSSVSKQKGVNKAKIWYMSALMGQPQKEWQQRPDRVEQ